jgi:hypothetical protein
MYEQLSFTSYDRASGHFNNDLSYNRRSVIVVGTELQIYNKFCEMIEKHGWQLQDSWDRELKPEYLKHYKSNNNLPIIIKINIDGEIHKRLHEINTFQCVDNELYLRGKDEMGEDFTLCFDAFNFLEWIDKEQIEYIKEQTN